MKTRITTVEELQQLFVETLVNKTNKVTKVSRNSALGGVSFGVAKVGQKAIKDVALVESELFADFASGSGLDDVASKNGISARAGANESSTYVLIFADPGTIYQQGVNIVSGFDGQNFDFDANVTVPASGFIYAKVRSTDQGAKTKLGPASLTTVTPTPVGHKYLINEFAASGGRDAEDDKVFRQRIKETPNIFAQKTLSFLEQAFNKVNPNVLRVFFQGFNDSGQVVLAVLQENGIDLTNSELDELLDRVGDNLALSDIKDFGNFLYGVKLINMEYQPIDISYRALLDNSFDPDEIRKEAQAKMQRAIDYRFWEETDKIQWVDLLQIAKNVKGTKYIPDQSFSPNIDIQTDNNKLPRIRGFRILDLDGNIISNVSGTLNPVFYPAPADFAFQSTILNTI